MEGDTVCVCFEVCNKNLKKFKIKKNILKGYNSKDRLKSLCHSFFFGGGVCFGKLINRIREHHSGIKAVA